MYLRIDDFHLPGEQSAAAALSADNAPPLVAKHLREQRVAAGQAFTYQAGAAGNGAEMHEILGGYSDDIGLVQGHRYNDNDNKNKKKNTIIYIYSIHI